MRKASAILLDLTELAVPLLTLPRTKGLPLRPDYLKLRAELAEACNAIDRLQFLDGPGTLLSACCWHVLYHAEKSAEGDDMIRWQMAGLMFVPLAQRAAQEAIEYEHREGVAEHSLHREV